MDRSAIHRASDSCINHQSLLSQHAEPRVALFTIEAANHCNAEQKAGQGRGPSAPQPSRTHLYSSSPRNGNLDEFTFRDSFLVHFSGGEKLDHVTWASRFYTVQVPKRRA